ncbi:hypothetical protein Cma02nite_08650 [Cellulomonas marina]|uniref:TadE-like protein n=1 Tax=Cellulomonas marina TaxID=988821 RepID=A0A1I0V1J6_9CELL|nr:hypothetical protein Cma02nite_08650 [Cellulomonas marina]SFA70194.1 hypothetical protein SAMN05421867_10192 [Cellulomonas marina]
MLAAALLAVLVAGVLQLALALHVRTVLADSAAEGARYAAVGGRTPADGVARTRALVVAALDEAYARDVTAGPERLDGLDVVAVHVSAPLPVLGLLGPAGRVEVVGHALAEDGP